MWETLAEIIGELRMLNPDLADEAGGLLEYAFGYVRFVYLRREDAVAQAVSLVRAEQTNVWHDPVRGTRAEPDQEAQYDLDLIHRRVQEIDQHNAGWQRWFSAVGIEPYQVTYEELAADPVGITHRILDFLGLEMPLGREMAVQYHRLADEVSSEWIARYRAELAGS